MTLLAPPAAVESTSTDWETGCPGVSEDEESDMWVAYCDTAIDESCHRPLAPLRTGSVEWVGSSTSSAERTHPAEVIPYR